MRTAIVVTAMLLMAAALHQAQAAKTNWNRGWRYCPVNTKHQGKVVMYDLRLCNGPIKGRRDRQ